jgi:SnoaL-like domain
MMMTVHGKMSAALVADHVAIMNLEGAYAIRYDARDGDGWSALFVEDGLYEGREPMGSGSVNHVQGRAALSRFCSDAAMRGIHILGVPHLEVSGDVATGRSNFVFHGVMTDESGRDVTRYVEGYYDIAYVRLNGEWLIRRRTTVPFRRSLETIFGYDGSVVERGSCTFPFGDRDLSMQCAADASFR